MKPHLSTWLLLGGLIVSTDISASRTPLQISEPVAVESSNQLAFELSLATVASTDQHYQYELIGLTAKANIDFIARSGQFLIEQGQSQHQLRVQLVNDQQYECAEHLLLVVKDQQGKRYQGLGTITDNQFTRPRFAPIDPQAQTGLDFELPLCRQP